MRSIPFNYILFFPFQIKNCKGKTYRLKLSVFDAFRRGYFFVCVSYLLFKSNFMHFVEDSYTVKKSSFNSFPLPFFLKNDSLAKAGSMVTVTIWVCCKGGDGPVLTATCWVLCPPLQVSCSPTLIFCQVPHTRPCAQGNHQPGNCVAVIKLAVALQVFSWGLLHAFKGKEGK